VMELIEGPTLGEIIASRALPVTEAGQGARDSGIGDWGLALRLVPIRGSSLCP